MTSYLRHGSLVAQLENDQFNEDEGDATDRAYRRGWNHTVRDALVWVRDGWTPPLYFWCERDDDTAIDRAYCRAHNAAVRHVQRMVEIDERAKCEVADECAKADPVGFGLRELARSDSWHPHFDDEGQGA